MKTLRFKTNINCNNCVMSVTPNMNMLDNVESWKVDIDNPDKILEVVIDDEDVAAVIQAVKSAGYEIESIES